MSKKCPKCESNNVHLAATVPHALCVCFDCGHQWKNKYKPRKKTVFQKITASPEVLAEKLVYRTIEIAVNRVTYSCWKSTITEEAYRTKAEAIAATVEKLKEVAE